LTRGWRPIAFVGSGGTAEVWRVVAADGSEAALKMLKPEWRHHSAAATLLRREYEVLWQVAGANVVRVYELVEQDAVPALVMEYLPHGDLVPLLGAPPQHWLPAFRSVVGALLGVHRCGFGHGDVKARNVLFAADGSARLVDFTTAERLESPAAISTAAYSLPASLKAGARDGDCFALAVLLYELVTGRLPYGRDGPTDLGALPAVAVSDPRAAPLLAGATAALRAGGRVQGVSYFVDVIESVGPVFG